MKKGFRFFFSLMLAAALVCGTAGCFAEEAQVWIEGSIVRNCYFTAASGDNKPSLEMRFNWMS